MGNLQSSILGHFTNVSADEGPVFVIPRHINFTPVQMSTMISVGQQPGVPFRVGGEGAQRPSRPTKKAQITDNLGSIYKNSFAMVIDEEGNFSISFKYDAIIPLTLKIYFGARDAHSVKEIRPKRVSHQWGPFDLATGKNVTWNSNSEFVHGDIQNLTCSYESDKERGQHLHYDFIVVLDSTITCREYLKNSDASAVVIQASYYSVNPSCFKTEKTQKKYGDDARMQNLSGSKVSARETEWNEQNQKQSSPMNSSSIRVLQHYEQLNQMHVLFGVVGNISLTCRQQKVQMNSGDVYVVQDLYGMSTGPSADNATTTTTTDDNQHTTTEDESPTPIDSNLDTDSPECVICLTDEKEVVVYPCRHMCMCITCAEALPSQGNKCPMCRRPASMLLRLKSKNSEV